MLPADRLRDKLLTMGGKGVQVYRDLAGAYRFERFVLHLEAVSPDPAAPSAHGRVRIDQAEAQVPLELWADRPGRIAVQDFLARALREAVHRHVRTRWSGRVAPLVVDAGGQEILARTSCAVAEEFVEMRLMVNLPAEGRKVLSKPALAVFFEELPAAVASGLVWANLDAEAARRHWEAYQDFIALQDALDARGLVAFLADGSLLARDAGPGDRPLRGTRAVALRAPDELAVTVDLPYRGTVRGLGIPRGVTVIAGGMFQGKSTLLEAIGKGVYAHIPGDGRELVATLPDAVTVRADAGRRFERVDLGIFLTGVPHRPDPTSLSVEHATGALSMAASVAEALEVGTRLLLVDEDYSAVAFLARDAAMQRLIPAAQEPHTALVDLVRPLWERLGVSTIIATGGLGDFLGVADTVIVMDGFQPQAATARARSIVADRADRRESEGRPVAPPTPRVPLPRAFSGLRGRGLRAETRGRAAVALGREVVELAALAQLVDPSQARAAADAILYAIEKGYLNGVATVAEILDRVYADIEAEGLDALALSEVPRDYALPRRHEVAAVLNRLRLLQARPRRGEAGRLEEPVSENIQAPG